MTSSGKRPVAPRSWTTRSNHPIAFGNWNRGYLVADRSEIMLTVDANISTPGQIKLYARKRVGGCVLNDEAIKVLKFVDARV